MLRIGTEFFIRDVCSFCEGYMFLLSRMNMVKNTMEDFEFLGPMAVCPTEHVDGPLLPAWLLPLSDSWVILLGVQDIASLEDVRRQVI